MLASNKIKQVFFKAMAVSVRLYGCTTWTPTNRMGEKVDVNYAKMQPAILNKCRKQPMQKQINKQTKNFKKQNNSNSTATHLPSHKSSK